MSAGGATSCSDCRGCRFGACENCDHFSRSSQDFVAEVLLVTHLLIFCASELRGVTGFSVRIGDYCGGGEKHLHSKIGVRQTKRI